MTKIPAPLQYLERDNTRMAIREALPKHMTEARIQSTAKTLLRQNPGLQDVQPQSFVGAVIQCAALGLDPTGALGHCYLIPFNQKGQKLKAVQLIIGYRGMIDLARRSGQIQSIEAHAVRKGDEFEYEFGLHPKLKHKPGSTPKAELTHAYAVAHLKGGGVQWEVMTRAEIDAIRQRSKSSGDGPWVTDFDEMAKKTVIRRLFKYLPVSVEMQTAVGLDEQADANIDQGLGTVLEGTWEAADETSAEPEKPKDTKSRARAAVAAAKEAAEPEPPEPDDDGAVDSLQADLMSALDEVGDLAGLEAVLEQAAEMDPELAQPVYAKADEVADRINS